MAFMVDRPDRRRAARRHRRGNDEDRSNSHRPRAESLPNGLRFVIDHHAMISWVGDPASGLDGRSLALDQGVDIVPKSLRVNADRGGATTPPDGRPSLLGGPGHKTTLAAPKGAWWERPASPAAAAIHAALGGAG